MKVLLAGETFLATTSVAVGGDTIINTSWSNGALAFNSALAASGFMVTQIGGEHCGSDFPRTLAELAGFDAVILSDVGALTLLVTPDARGGLVGPNRLELLKAFSGVKTHETQLDIPVFENEQDMDALAARVETRLKAEGLGWGFLLAGHGIYAWGKDVGEALRHLDAFDYLFTLMLKLKGVPV